MAKRSRIDQAIQQCELEIAHQLRVLEHLKGVRGEKPTTKPKRKAKVDQGVKAPTLTDELIGSGR